MKRTLPARGPGWGPVLVALTCVVAPGEADAQEGAERRQELSLQLSPCLPAWLDAVELRESLQVELTLFDIALVDTSELRHSLALRCTGEGALQLSLHGASAAVDLGDVAPEARLRTLAIAIAEWVAAQPAPAFQGSEESDLPIPAARPNPAVTPPAPRVPSPHVLSAPLPTEPSAEPTNSARPTPEATPRRARLELMPSLVGLPLGVGAALGGAEIGLDVPILQAPWRIRTSLAGAGWRTRVEPGDIDVALTRAGIGVALEATAGPFSFAAGLELLGGWFLVDATARASTRTVDLHQFVAFARASVALSLNLIEGVALILRAGPAVPLLGVDVRVGDRSVLALRDVVLDVGLGLAVDL